VRVFGGRRVERGAGGLPWPLSHQTQTVGGRWTGQSHCQRAKGGHGAEGEGQPRPTEFIHTEKEEKKTHTHKKTTVTDEIYVKNIAFRRQTEDDWEYTAYKAFI